MRTLELDLLRTFVAIADRESFARAADQVHRTQSAVTQQMARLEAQLGVALFRKVGRSKRLSEHGVRLLEYARRLLALNDEALASLAAADLRGPLRIGSTYDAAEFMLPPLLARFSQLYANVQIEVHTARTAHLLQALKDGDIEIALVATPEGTADAGIFPRVRLRTSPMVWMASAEYVHDRSQPVPLVLPNEPSGYRATALATLDAQRMPWRIRHGIDVARVRRRARRTARGSRHHGAHDRNARFGLARRVRSGRPAATAHDRSRPMLARQARESPGATAVRIAERTGRCAVGRASRRDQANPEVAAAATAAE